MMKSLMDLRDMLCEELDEVTRKGELSAGSLETVHKLTDTIKNIDKITMLEEGNGGGYSGDGEWTARGNYANNGSYRRGSYGDGSYDDGRYSGTYRSGRSYARGRYSRSEGADMMRERINEMMRQPDMSSEERNVLQRAMQIVSER